MNLVTLALSVLPVALQFSVAQCAVSYADIAVRKHNDLKYLRQFWIFLASVIVFFTLVNIWGRLSWLLSRRRGSPAQPPTKEPTKVDSEKVEATQVLPTPPRSARICASVSTAFKITAFRWSLRIGPYNFGTVGELTFIFSYISANFIWLFVDTRGVNVDFYKARAGMIATAQLPLVIALANKNNIVSWLTGISHEKLNVLHRASGRVVFIFMWIHAIGRVVNGIPPRAHFTDAYMQAGIVGITALTAGVFLSLKIFRQVIFEFFFIMHVGLMLIFIIAAYIHVHPLGFGYLVWPSFILWGLDRVLRLGGLLWNNIWRCSEENKAQATVEMITPETLQLTMKRKFTWKPGQHAYICVPKLSLFPFEFHPFTISTIPEKLDGTHVEDKEVSFFIRCQSGMTKRLKKHLQQNGAGTVTAYVDGPYGFPPEVHRFSTSILVAGGSGISYTLPILMDLIRRSASGINSEVRRVKFIWVVRGESHLPWINGILAEALAMGKDPLDIDACIYVTGSNITQENKPVGSIRGSEKDVIYVEPESVDSFSGKIYHGRPDLQKLIDEEILSAQGPVSVDIAGPFGLTNAIKEALTSGAATPSSALKGRQPVTLHVETFGMA